MVQDVRELIAYTADLKKMDGCGRNRLANHLLALNAAIEAARAGEAGPVLRWWRTRVRKLSTLSSETAKR